MRRAQHSRPLKLLGVPAAALLICGLALTAGPASAATNLVTNPGFETGTLSGWTCSAADGVTTSPVHAGSYALAGAASSSDDAQCSQSVSVQPSSSYTMTGWVQGDYVFIGDSGTGSSDTDNWTASAPGWQRRRPVADRAWRERRWRRRDRARSADRADGHRHHRLVGVAVLDRAGRDRDRLPRRPQRLTGLDDLRDLGHHHRTVGLDQLLVRGHRLQRPRASRPSPARSRAPPHPRAAEGAGAPAAGATPSRPTPT